MSDQDIRYVVPQLSKVMKVYIIGSQVPFAEAVKKAHPDISIGAVGMITTPKQANDVLVEGKADVVSLAREFLRDPHFVLRAADELGVAVRPAVQFERAWQTVLARL